MGHDFAVGPDFARKGTVHVKKRSKCHRTCFAANKTGVADSRFGILSQNVTVFSFNFTYIWLYNFGISEAAQGQADPDFRVYQT